MNPVESSGPMHRTSHSCLTTRLSGLALALFLCALGGVTPRALAGPTFPDLGQLPTNAPVVVTLSMRPSNLVVGATNQLTVYARIAPTFQPLSEQIFSWNLDLLCLTPSVAAYAPSGLRFPSSDNEAGTASYGVRDGADLRNLKDTFLKLSGAGRTSEVALVTIPVVGLAPGRALFVVRPGLLIADGGADFLVVPLSDDAPFEGGDYSAAALEVDVVDLASQPPELSIRRNASGTLQIEATIPPGPGFLIEQSPRVGEGAQWTSLGLAAPGLFSTEVPPADSARFFRARRP